MARLWDDRGKIEAPPEDEIAAIIELARKVMAGKDAESDPLSAVETFEKIMFDMNEVREKNLEMEDIPAENIEEMFTGQIGELIEAGKAGTPDGVQSITTEDIIPQYYKGKKGPVPWYKVSREIQTQIRVGMHAAVKHFPDDVVQINDFGGEGKNDVGPIIIFSGEKE